jgi:tRNA-uridine 2-sulfurtransferase
MESAKAEKAYNPDKDGRKETIVVGLSGGIKSYVTASLLKIQKYDVIGVTVQNDPQGFQGPLEKIVGCHASEQKLDEIRLFCRSLGIPHFVVKSGLEFQENVVEAWKSSRVEGSFSRQCGICHRLRMKILYQEMRRLGSKKLATGHLGKIFIQNEKVFLRSSNDEKNDQSGLLSELPENILKSLLLPLSDLQYTEILRLADNFELKRGSEGLTSCFPNTEAIFKFLEQSIPPGIRKPGALVLPNGDKFDDHEGVQNFIFGESIDPKDSPGEHVFINYNHPAKEVLLGTFKDFESVDFFINCETLSDREALLGPSVGYARIEGGEVECWISPKTLGRIHVLLTERRKVLPGMTVSIFRKPGRNSKLLVTGRVSSPVSLSDDEEADEKTRSSSPKYSR